MLKAITMFNKTPMLCSGFAKANSSVNALITEYILPFGLLNRLLIPTCIAYVVTLPGAIVLLFQCIGYLQDIAFQSEMLGSIGGDVKANQNNQNMEDMVLCEELGDNEMIGVVCTGDVEIGQPGSMSSAAQVAPIMYYIKLIHIILNESVNYAIQKISKKYTTMMSIDSIQKVNIFSNMKGEEDWSAEMIANEPSRHSGNLNPCHDYMIQSKRAQQMDTDIERALMQLVTDSQDASTRTLLSCFYPLFNAITANYINKEEYCSNDLVLSVGVNFGLVILSIQVLVSYMQCSVPIYQEQLLIFENRLVEYVNIMHSITGAALVASCGTCDNNSNVNKPIRKVGKKEKRLIIDDEDAKVEDCLSVISDKFISNLSELILVVSCSILVCL